MRGLDNVIQLDDAGMIQLFHDMILPLDFLWTDGKQHFHCHVLLGLLVEA